MAAAHEATTRSATYDELTDLLERAKSAPSSDLVEQLALVYLDFALEHSAEFRFMFRRDLCMPPGQPDPLEVASRASQAMVTAALSDEITAGRFRQQDAETASLGFWSMVHGFTTIVLETPAFTGIARADAERLLLVLVGQWVEGARAR